MAATNPADGAVRRSIQGALGDKLKEVTDLANALNVEIFLLDERRENTEAENERLTAELAKYTGWEPTVREEYEHAIGQLDAARKVVEKFDGSDKLRVNQFLADLKHALEM